MAQLAPADRTLGVQCPVFLVKGGLEVGRGASLKERPGLLASDACQGSVFTTQHALVESWGRSFRVGLSAKRTFTAATRSTSLHLPRAALCMKCRKGSL